MSPTQTHRALHEMFNRRDFEGMRQHVADSYRYVDCATGEVYASFDEFTGFLRMWADGFSDARVEAPTYYESGHVSVCEFRGRGTHDGTLRGMPATGRSMDMAYCEIMHVDDAGRATGGEIFYDRLTLLEQLGLAQAPAASAKVPGQAGPAPAETGTPTPA